MGVCAQVSQRVGEGVLRRYLVTPYRRAMDGNAPAENLSQGQLPKLLEGSSAVAAMAAVQVRAQGPGAVVGRSRRALRVRDRG